MAKEGLNLNIVLTYGPCNETNIQVLAAKRNVMQSVFVCVVHHTMKGIVLLAEIIVQEYNKQTVGARIGHL